MEHAVKCYSISSAAGWTGSSLQQAWLLRAAPQRYSLAKFDKVKSHLPESAAVSPRRIEMNFSSASFDFFPKIKSTELWHKMKSASQIFHFLLSFPSFHFFFGTFQSFISSCLYFYFISFFVSFYFSLLLVFFFWISVFLFCFCSSFLLSLRPFAFSLRPPFKSFFLSLVFFLFPLIFTFHNSISMFCSPSVFPFFGALFFPSFQCSVSYSFGIR